MKKVQFSFVKKLRAILFLSLVIIIILQVAVYMNIGEISRENMESRNYQEMTKVSDSLDALIIQVEENMLRFFNTTRSSLDTLDYEKLDYYERNIYKSNLYNLTNIYTNTLIDSFYIYNIKKNYIVKSDGFIQLESEEEKKWIEKIINDKKEIIVSGARKNSDVFLPVSNNSRTNIISIVLKYPLLSYDKGYIMVVNVDMLKMYGELKTKSENLHMNNNGFFVVLNEKNQLYAAPEKIVYHYYNNENIDWNNTDFIKDTGILKNNNITVKEYSKGDFKYYYYYTNVWYHNISFNMAAIIIICILFILIELVFIQVMKRKVTGPISRFLGKVLNFNEDKEQNDYNKDEFDIIADSYLKTQSSIESLEKEIRENKDVLREKFIYNLINYNILSKEEIESNFEYYGINLPVSNLGIIIINILNLEKVAKDMENIEKVAYRQEISDKIREACMFNRNFILEVSTDRLVVIMHAGQDNNRVTMRECTERIRFELKKSLSDISFSFVAGREADEIRLLPERYNECKEIEKYGTQKEFYSILDVTCTDSKENKKTGRLYEFEDEILDAIKSENIHKADKMISEIIKYISEHNNDDIMEIKREAYMIYENICRYLYSVNNEILSSINEEFEGLYDKLRKSNSIEIIKAILNNVIKKAVMIICKLRNNRRHMYVTQMSEYIYNNLDKPISLETMAEHIALSPTYACSIFKERTGKTFSAFLNDARMDKAAKLLKNDSNYKIKDIALMCGYNNTQYFIRVFRKHYGRTPGQFKGIH